MSYCRDYDLVQKGVGCIRKASGGCKIAAVA